MNTVHSIGHIAIPVFNIPDTRKFYSQVLGCPEGRLSDVKVDFNFFGQHLVAHVGSPRLQQEAAIEQTQEERLSRHFGVIVELEEWKRVVESLKQHDIRYVAGPLIKNPGTEREEGFLMFRDPSENTVEIKGFNNPSLLSSILADHIPGAAQR